MTTGKTTAKMGTIKDRNGMENTEELYKKDLHPKKIKSLTVSTVSPSICHGVMGPDAMILVF